MRPFHKYILFLILLYVLLISSGYFLVSVCGLNFPFCDIVILSSLFSVVTLVVLIIFFRGLGKEPGSQTIHTLASVSIKIIFELLLALIWFIVAKKISLSSILIFFTLYLSVTLFSIWVILKMLRDKPL